MPGAISSVASSSLSAMRPEALEAPGRDVKNDHDSDDLAGAASAKPTVNTQGQILGTILNTKA